MHFFGQWTKWLDLLEGFTSRCVSLVAILNNFLSVRRLTNAGEQIGQDLRPRNREAVNHVLGKSRRLFRNTQNVPDHKAKNEDL